MCGMRAVIKMSSERKVSEEADQFFVHNEDSEFDQMLARVPESIIDNRTYYWPNFVQPHIIYHERFKFVYSFRLPTITQSRAYYVASFGESLLLTWVGLEARIFRRIGDSTSIKVDVVKGSNPFVNDRVDTIHYCNVPPPVRQQEHIAIHRRTTEDRVDFGQNVHVRVHRNFSLELNTRITNHTILSDIVIVVKVQTPRLVGGSEDHIMWNQAEYEMRKKSEQDNFLYHKKLIPKTND